MQRKPQPVSLTADAIALLSYEEGYARLQEVLEALESGELPLEDSLKLYELGTQLAAHCGRKLEEAELKVKQWQEDGALRSFDDWQEA